MPNEPTLLELAPLRARDRGDDDAARAFVGRLLLADPGNPEWEGLGQRVAGEA